MVGYHILQLAPMIVACGIAAITDLRHRRIPNALTMPLILTGIASSFLAGSALLPWQALLGMAVGFALPLALFLLGALGAGDVKLLAGIGAWTGARGVIEIFAVAAIIGMIYVIVISMRRGQFAGLLRRSALVSINVMHADVVGVEDVLQSSRSADPAEAQLPYAVPALIGVLLVMFAC
jgi:prepilin peptidase CpaA